MHKRSLLGSISCLLLCGSLFAQNPTPTPQLEPHTPPAPTHIVLDVVAADRSGLPVTGLAQQNFTVLDDGKPLPIVGFHATTLRSPEDPPVEVTFVVDEVNTSFNRVAYERNQIENFLKANSELKHPVRLAFFSDTNSEMQMTGSTDAHTVLADFDQHEAKLRTLTRSTGIYGAVDRFQLSLGMLRKITADAVQRPGRKVILWISPGWPMLSGPAIDLNKREEQGLFQTVVSLSTEMRQGRVTLYSIDPLGVADAGSTRTSYYEEFLKPITKYQNVTAGNLALQVLATQSGGLVMNSSNDIASEIARSISDADTYYTLTVEQPPAEPNQFHHLEVRLDNPGLRARTRNGYYGQY